MTTTTTWTFLDPWLAEHFPALAASLNPGASPDAWDALEQAIGIELPADFKAFYAVHDGQHTNDPTGFFFGLEFLSSASSYRQWQAWRTVTEQEGESGIQEMSENGRSLHPGKVKTLYTNLRWIPFTHDWGGNHIGIDLDPDENGVVGQVINFGRDEDDKFVLADSFGAFMEWMVAQLQSGNYAISDDTDDGHTDFALKEHPESHFTDVAKEIFVGAVEE